jgi:cytosine permease
MADYWLHHKGSFPSLGERQPAFNWAGIIAYLLASAVAYFSPGIKPINGIITDAIRLFYFEPIPCFYKEQSQWVNRNFFRRWLRRCDRI